MSFRILNQAPQYLLPSGKVNAGGKLYFYETDLSTPKNTWSDEAMGVLNPNPVLMDAAGRTATDVWGDGEYGVVMTDSADVEIWTRNNVRPDAGAAAVLPDPSDGPGEAIFSDGSNYVLQPVRQLPDPTGLANYTLVSDGTDWLAQLPDNPDIPEIDVGAGSFQIGDILFQFGHDNFPAASVPPYHASSQSVSFPQAFDTCNGVLAICNKIGIVPNGDSGIVSATYTSSLANFNVDINSAETDPSRYITAPVPFTWLAFGTKAA